MVYLWSGSILWLNPSLSRSTTVSPPLGYQMCLAQFGMRHTQINILPRGATLESPRWVSKKNILSFISSRGRLDVVVCSGTISGSGIIYQSRVSLSLEGMRHTWYFSQTNSKVHAVFLLLNWDAVPHTQWWYENSRPSAYAPAVARFFLTPSSPVYPPKSFCFPSFSTHSQHGSHTFFPHLHFWTP